MPGIARQRGRRSRLPGGRPLARSELLGLEQAIARWSAKPNLRKRLRRLVSSNTLKRLASAELLVGHLARHKVDGDSIIAVPRASVSRLQNVLNDVLQAIDLATNQCGVWSFALPCAPRNHTRRYIIYWIQGREPSGPLTARRFLKRLVPRGVGSNAHSVSIALQGTAWYVPRVELEPSNGEPKSQAASETLADSLRTAFDAITHGDLSLPEPDGRALIGALTAISEIRTNPTEERVEDAAKTLLACYPALDDVSYWYRWRHLATLAELTSQFVTEHAVESATGASLMYRAGLAADTLGNSVAGRKYLTSSARLCEANGLDSLLTFVLTQLGDALSTLGDQAQAIKQAERVLSLRAHLGVEGPLLARAHCDLGSAMIDTASAPLPRPMLQRAILQFETARSLWQDSVVLGDTSQYAWCLYSLAMARYLEGDIKAAEESLFPALGLKQLEVGKDHPQIAFFRALEARLLSSQGRLVDASKRSQEALELWTNAFQDRHPLLVRLLLLRAELASTEGRTREVMSLLERADATRRVLIPENGTIEKKLNAVRAGIAR